MLPEFLECSETSPGFTETPSPLSHMHAITHIITPVFSYAKYICYYRSAEEINRLEFLTITSY